MSSEYISNKLYVGVLDMIRITLNKALQNRDMSRYELAKRTGIQYQIIDNYYKNRVVRYDSYVLNRICEALPCDICELITYESEKTEQ